MGYTTSDAINRIKLKGFVSSSTGLSDSDILNLLEDSLRSYIVPFTKVLRDEWWVGKTDTVVTVDANSQVSIPNTVATTLRTVAWNNNGILIPLTRIEPENSFQYQNMGSGNVPYGYMLRGYTLQVLPPSPNAQLHLTAMYRPPDLVLEESAAEIESFNSGTQALTLADVPLAWQETTPTVVDIISSNSPFSATAESVTVVSLVGTTLTVTGLSASDVEAGFWVSDAGSSPFPNIPIELHPLLEQDVICTIYQAVGDKRLNGVMDRKKEMEATLRATLAPRVAGSSKPIVNKAAPGMRGLWRRSW